MARFQREKLIFWRNFWWAWSGVFTLLAIAVLIGGLALFIATAGSSSWLPLVGGLLWLWGPAIPALIAMVGFWKESNIKKQIENDNPPIPDTVVAHILKDALAHSPKALETLTRLLSGVEGEEPFTKNQKRYIREAFQEQLKHFRKSPGGYGRFCLVMMLTYGTENAKHDQWYTKALQAGCTEAHAYRLIMLCEEARTTVSSVRPRRGFLQRIDDLAKDVNFEAKPSGQHALCKLVQVELAKQGLSASSITGAISILEPLAAQRHVPSMAILANLYEDLANWMGWVES